MDYYFYVKALHIIFVVTWFAGLFYIVRLFIYFAEAAEKPEPERTILQEQFKIMQKRLWYGITWPSAVLTLIFGLSMWNLYGGTPNWLIWKICFVIGLYVYHFLCHAIFKQQQQGTLKYTSTQLRIWNEVATLFLISIVFLVVLKSSLSMLWGIIGLILFSAILMLAIRIYKRTREKS
ncbi:CopD family protein [Pontibacter sp. BT310]|uniref:Protoporphyrinogen IX oxidase n=1 Tax=Pontibacter populi TaxID=890055 RepID=A0ABS6XDL5_9BACT|nr:MULTISPECIES: CopD family protein [Pontibacter]MBJ6119133.1 CopD family protein [Pontibacter sp. BT310]MBR0571561.1 CopD family protein [Microvirga sp. STS03]MBW3365987.1 CopD family protein [Pontibacter populi]